MPLEWRSFSVRPILRVFSYWRTVEPRALRGGHCKGINRTGRIGEKENVIIGLENEHACNVGTAEETARILKRVTHPKLNVVWDPANALCAGEDPFPRGYSELPKERIAHVHAKDCHIGEDGKPVWGPLGTRDVLWKEQIRALLRRWLPRLHQLGDALERAERQQQARGEPHLRLELTRTRLLNAGP